MTVLPQTADVETLEDCQSSAPQRKLDLAVEPRGPVAPGQYHAIMDLLLSLRTRGIEIKCDGALLRVSATPGALDDEVRDQITRGKPAILAFLSPLGTSSPAKHRLARRGAHSAEEQMPLTHSQQRLWILQELLPGASVYNLPYAFRIEGALDADMLAASFTRLVERHEALRTTFAVHQGVPYQKIDRQLAFGVERQDLSAEPEDASRLLDILEQEARKPFDLAHGPLVRATIFALDATRHVLFFNIHHIVCDGWSIEILLDELVTIYDALAGGAHPVLPPLPVGPADFALWERENVTPDRMAEALAFFKQQLAGAPESLELPTDRARGGEFSYRGASHNFAIDPELVRALTALGQQHQSTLYMVMLAAFDVMLSRSSGQKDVVVGSPVAGRQELGAEGEGLVGFFVNTIVLRTNLADEPTFIDLLSRVRAACLSTYEHQSLPFQWLVESLNPSRDRSRTAVYQAMFAFQDARQRRLSRGELRWTRIEALQAGGAKTDLTLLLEHHASNTAPLLLGSLEFSSDLFDRQTIERFARDYETLLRSIVANPDRSVARLDLLHPDTRQALQKLNATARPLPTLAGGGFHELIEAQTLRAPAAIAIIDSVESLTYAELERRANRLANHLVGLGVGRGSRVGVAVGRSARLLQATLGILKAGAAYVPLDPDFPTERLEYMLRDAELSLVISESSLRDRLPAGDHRMLWLDRDAEAIGAAGDGASSVRNGGADPAYVIYTSGSTGRPKGVVLPHRAVVNFLASMAAEPGCTSRDKLIAVTTLSFDIAVLELFLPLTVGARSIIAPREALTDGGRLLRLIAEHDATIMQATPVTWQLLLDAGWSGKPGFKALCGGEAFPAIANTQLYILDEHRQQVPFGVMGELYIGGEGVALGYLHRPELTQERFVPDAFSVHPAARLYRTGDLARQLPDGVLFVGRADNQIKLRGHRIELGEIEAVLNGEADVARCAVVIRDFGAGDQRIVAFVVSAEAATVDTDRLRRWARARLPDYMVPQHIVVLPTMPLTPNGKIDRRALPMPQVSGPSRDESKIAPSNAIEELLLQLWRRVLQVDEIGVTDNFFDLGGHSLLAVRLAQLISEACHVDLSLAVIFKAPTIREQSIAIDGGFDADGISVVPLHPHGERKPLFCICGINLYQHLARNLGANRPVYGVFLPVEGALFGKQGTKLSVREMAAEYVKAIRGQQPKGPYHLAGVSFGGVLAYETAQQLWAAGEEVGVLALLDVVLPEGFEFSWRRFAREHLRRLRAQGPSYLGEKRDELREKADAWLDQKSAGLPRIAGPWLQRVRAVLHPPVPATMATKHADGSTEASVEALQRLRVDQYDAASREYLLTLRPYPGAAVLFRARDEDRPVGSRVRPDCGWSRYISPAKMTLHEVPGDHLGILTETSVRELARLLRARFELEPSTTT